MNIGMLWFDDSSRPLKEKIRRAVEFYTEKYGREPTLCLVNPKTLNGGGGAVGGIEVREGASVMLDHYWIGVEERENKPPRKRRAKKAA